jgi:hypothetical protein
MIPIFWRRQIYKDGKKKKSVVARSLGRRDEQAE